MGLQPKTTELSIVDENLWLLSQSYGKPQTGTLDLTKFETDAAGGVIVDSTTVVFNPTSKLYEPAIFWDVSLTPDAYAQVAVADGHVFQPVSYDAGATRAPFALFWQGRVSKAHVHLPTAHAGAAFDASKGAKGIVYV